MDLYLSVPGGKPIGDLHDRILELGFDGVRVDLPDEHTAATNVLREFAERPHVKAIILIAGGHMTRNHPKTGGPAWTSGELVAHVLDTCIKMNDLGLFARSEPPAIEIGNEPDLAAKEWKDHPRELAETFRRCYDVIHRHSDLVPVLSPSVSNLNKRGFKYLENMTESGLPARCGIAVHRYPNGPSGEIPHDGFDSREEEVERLLAAARRRPIWITEVGMREGPHTKERYYLSEDDVAREFEREALLWAGVAQVQGLVWYQINDGPDRGNELHTYGIRRIDNTWKPVAERVAVVKAKLA